MLTSVEFALVFIAILFVRFAWVLFWSSRASFKPGPVMIVLGSGGHTAEMLRWLDIAKPTRKIVFVVSATDGHSAAAAKKYDANAVVRVIPRAREVGQSYFTSIFTTLRALFASLAIVWSERPATIAVNGPGVCVPVIAADILIVALFALFWWPGRRSERAALLYIESFACVHHLSLSGRILLPIAHRFVVQWPELYKKVGDELSNEKKRTVLSYSGAFPLLAASDTTNKKKGDDGKEEGEENGSNQQDTASSSKQERLLKKKKEPPFFPPNNSTCVVTVGSTKFDDLIRVVDSERFELAIKRLGITHLLVQKGASTVRMRYTTEEDNLNKCAVPRTVVDYKHGLGDDIAKAALVISHAGAGTILEAMAARVATVVVPNEKLMSNHQLELAHGLGDRGYLCCATPSKLVGFLERDGNDGEVDWTGFKPLPPPDKVAFNNSTHPFFSP